MGFLKRLALFALPLSCVAPETTGHFPAAQPREPTQSLRAPEPPALVLLSEADAPVLRQLAVPGFEPALLFSPAGSAPRPLVLAAHGAGGGPEWECEYWRRLTRAQAFILCLTGTPFGGSYSGYFYRDHRALDRELTAAEQAARAAEPRILAGSGIYAGFSQGATMGTPIITLHANSFPYVVLIEGFMPWNVPGAQKFARAGGKRVLFACGSKECAKVAQTSAHWFQVAGSEARLEYAPGAGHTPAGPVMERVTAALPWLLQGDPHWSAID